LVLIAGPVACDRPESEQRGAGQVSRASDSDLENTIKSKLESDPQLQAAKLDVDADAEKNEVTISGTVESQELRQKAVELARNTQPGITVNDKIDVKPAENTRAG
jgi:osmotically-inducible protein OsmY